MKIVMLIFLVLSVLFQLSYSQDPCGQWRYGENNGKLDADLHTWDVIQDFELNNYERHSGTVSEITGSSSYQTAYRFERESNLTMRAHDAFPRGIPFQFSFECTYRNRQPQLAPWHIFHVTNSLYESQLSMTMNPVRKTLAVSLPDSFGNLQTVEFRHSSLFDSQWHKIMLGVTENRAKLWVDCQPVRSVDGYIENPLRKRGQFDIKEGFLSIAQLATPQRQPSPPIDLQWLVMTCDPSRPLRQQCDEIPMYEVAGAQAEYVEGPPPQIQQPCQTCPAGAKGERGPQGERGLRGFDGRDGINGLPGLKGEKGERGIPGLPGGNAIENVVYRQGEKGEKGDEGERGPQGIQGLPGLQGPPGPPGETVETQRESSGSGYTHYVFGGGVGAPGQNGAPGPRGNPGPPGVNGMPGRSVTDDEIRDICYIVLREQLTDITANLIGPQGPPGPAGRQGKRGEQGSDGLPGEKGSRGYQGVGIPGLPGVPGPQGERGESGERGEKGERGEEGVGRAGPIGPQGPPGPAGVGEQGPRGVSGLNGEPGRHGDVGPRGPPGQPGQCPHDCYQAMTQANALYYSRAQGNQKGP